MNNLTQTLIELLRRTTACLPCDVLKVIEQQSEREAPGSRAAFALSLIRDNIALAEAHSRPICQDTGHLTFYVKIPTTIDPTIITTGIREAVEEATRFGYLRQNSVDGLTGKNSGDNLGPGTPHIELEFHQSDNIDIRLIQKGGGCENMSAQYSLPRHFGDTLFGRDLEGVRACILDAVHQAQGKGCGPGFLGVCIGGDRATGYAHAKRQFLRPLDDVNPEPKLAELEERILDEANRLDIGPLGFGGTFTLGSCKIGTRNRIPASYFVTIAYSCWAFRRRGVLLDPAGEVAEWLYRSPDEFVADEKPSVPSESFENAVRLQTPLTEETVRSLKIGRIVLISGMLYTGRDAVHKYLHEGGKLDIIRGGVFYHCGPIMKKKGDTYDVLAAGPTTSIREEPYEADIIREYGIRAVIGKGGMGRKTLEACKEYGCVYLHAIGGGAQIYAECINAVKSVHLEQFGSPEAVWELEVENFPAVVTIDAHGNSFHEEIENLSDARFLKLLKG